MKATILQILKCIGIILVCGFLSYDLYDANVNDYDSLICFGSFITSSTAMLVSFGFNIQSSYLRRRVKVCSFLFLFATIFVNLVFSLFPLKDSAYIAVIIALYIPYFLALFFLVKTTMPAPKKIKKTP